MDLARMQASHTACAATGVGGNRDRATATIQAREDAGVLPDDLLQTIRGFQESRIVLTAIELDVFTAAGAGTTAAAIAKAISADARATELLLNALVAMELLRKSDGRYSTTPVTEKFLSARGESDARTAMLHQSSLWPRWSKLTQCVREGTCPDFEELHERDDEWTTPFIAAMHRNASERARVVVAAVGTEGVRRMLDVGGGSGAYSIAFAEASEELRAEILDLETVLPITRGHIEEAGLSHRITTRAGDLRTAPLGEGYDLVFMSAICHSFDEAENRDLVARCREALAPGGRLVIQDFILDEDGTSPRFAALFSINMLTGTKGGRSYSESEYLDWMKAAELRDARRVPLPGSTDLVVGRR